MEKLEKIADRDYPSISASCYDPVPPKWVKAEIICERCGKKASLLVETYPDFGEYNTDIVARYNALAKRFVALGYSAKMSYYCYACVAKGEDELGPIVFSFQAPGMDKPALSYPDPQRYAPWKYEKALRFLERANSVFLNEGKCQGANLKEQPYYNMEDFRDLQSILAPNEVDLFFHKWEKDRIDPDQLS